MPHSLTADAKGALPLVPVAKAGLAAWLKTLSAPERAWVKSTGFDAAPGSVAYLPGPDGKAARVAVGADLKADALWALAGLPSKLREGKYRIEVGGKAQPRAPVATQLALGWALGAYAFTRYRKPRRAFAELVWPQHADRAEVGRLAEAVFLARDLVNTPAEDMGPPELAAAAKKLAVAHGAECSVIVGDDLLKKNYPTIHAVGRAATRAPRLIDIRWGKKTAPKVTLVGKGVCFDTGGLDLKPASGMLQMKKDMGGAAVVLALASALMSAKAKIRLRVLIPAVENAVSGNAIRPLDVVKTRLGKTVEIGNTDAEGRLILCDALAEADSESPKLLVDCATLTGAARVALGPELQAFFTHHDALAAKISAAGEAVSDPMWRLPLWAGYRKGIDGKIADLNNVSFSPHGGAITAALYLAEFVRPATEWVHVDIFASNASSRPGRPEGGEATAMRALYKVIRDRFK